MERSPPVGVSRGWLDSEVASRAISDAGAIGTLITSVEGDVVYADSGYRKLSGYDASELSRLNILDLIRNEDVAAAKDALAKLADAEPKPATWQGSHVRKDGTFARMSALQVARSEPGAPRLIVHQFFDQRVLAGVDNELRERDRLLATLRSMGDAVICADVVGSVTFINPAAQTLTGWSASDAIGQRVTTVVHLLEEQTGQPATDPTQECFSRNEPIIRESGILLRHRSGSVHDVGFSVAPIRQPDGRCSGVVILVNDVTEVRTHHRLVAHSASHDALTGLPNRMNFVDHLQAAIDQARRENRTHVLCFIDLDRFKVVNDRGGHAAGDALLKLVAELLSRTCQAGRINTARLGGDEFALLIRDCKVEEATGIAESVIKAIGEIRFPWDGFLFRIGASAGLTEITRDSPDLSEVLHEADKACYAAKESGRNRVRVSSAVRTPQDNAPAKVDRARPRLVR